MPQEFSWQCDLGRWRSLEPCFALCVKIIIIFNMQLCGFHCMQRYSICIPGVNYYLISCIFTASVCSTGSSCGQQGVKWISTLILLLECQTFALFNASHSNYLFLAQWRLVLSESAVITGHVSHIMLLFTTVITTVTMVISYSHVVPQDIWIILLVMSN